MRGKYGTVSNTDENDAEEMHWAIMTRDIVK